MIPEFLIIIFIVVLGLSIGSFLNVLIYRLPRQGISVWKPARSFCPVCQGYIKWYDNLPILSWLFLRGKCRNCKVNISWHYPLVEVSAMILMLAVYYLDGFNFRWGVHSYFVLSLLVISMIDIELMIIPDHLTIPGMILGLLAAIVSPDIALSGPWLDSIFFSYGFSLRLSSLFGSFLGIIVGGGSIWLVGLLYKVWRGQEGIGGGDLTLLAMIGAFLGWRSVPLVAFLASIFGIIAAIPLLLKQSENNIASETEQLKAINGDQQVEEFIQVTENNNQQIEDFIQATENDNQQVEDFIQATENNNQQEVGGSGLRIPFGPFLSLAALIYLFFGAKFWSWYLPY